ncbi:MAG: hypothetical protein R3E13_07260 [Alphaproteobacteria bacterium]
MMRMLFLTVMFLIFGIGAGFAQGAGAPSPVQFFEQLQDIPLMPGLAERDEDTVFFDKPGGRVVEAVADLEGFSQEAVERYYLLALPQFGWKNAGVNRFNRDGESLELVFEGGGDVQILRILVQPQ